MDWLTLPPEAWAQGGFFVLLFMLVLTGIFFTWKAGKWIGLAILKPSQEAFVKHLEDTNTNIKAQTVCLNEMSTTLKTLCKYDPNHHDCKQS